VRATVISNVRLSRDYNVLTIAAPEVGALTEPGQFVMLKTTDASDPMLRRPFSVFEVLRDDLGTVRAISILNKRAGRTTGLLYGLEAGDPVWCLGPLGLPFNPPSSGEDWMVAGRVGHAPFATRAQAPGAGPGPAPGSLSRIRPRTGATLCKRCTPARFPAGSSCRSGSAAGEAPPGGGGADTER